MTTYKSAENRKFQLEDLILKLFQRQNDLFDYWIKFLDRSRASYISGRLSRFGGSPVYYASLLRLGRVLQELLSPKQPEDVETYTLPQTSISQSADVNAQGGGGGFMAMPCRRHHMQVMGI